jgi:hypothetical protein
MPETLRAGSKYELHRSLISRGALSTFRRARHTRRLPIETGVSAELPTTLRTSSKRRA